MLPLVDHWLGGALLPVLHPDHHRVWLHHAGGAGVPPCMGHGDRGDGQHRGEGPAGHLGDLHTHTRDGVVVDHPRVLEPGT